MGKNINIIHIMLDGTRKESIEGVVVELNDKTEIAYSVLADREELRKGA